MATTVYYKTAAKEEGFCCCRGCANYNACECCKKYRADNQELVEEARHAAAEVIAKRVKRAERTLYRKSHISSLWNLLMNYRRELLSDGGLRIHYCIGTTQIPVCKKYWMQIHGATKHTLGRLVDSLKRGADIPSQCRPIVRLHKKNLSGRAEMCIQWLDETFEARCDIPPNAKPGTRHIDNITYEELYGQYKEKNYRSGIVSLERFRTLWHQHFPLTTIRKYKQVGGKCHECATLSQLRLVAVEDKDYAEIQHWGDLHNSSQMRERRQYYNRRAQARRNPEQVVSIIADGMAQCHTRLPYAANMYEGSKELDLHLMGVIDHRYDRFYAFLAYGNVIADTNFNLYCAMFVFEDIMLNNPEDSVPRVFYYQVDGAATNANSVTLALLELLVARGIVDEVVMTRLPVGHTHEDIDGRFGKLWEAFRARHINTALEYIKGIQNVFKGTGENNPYHRELKRAELHGERVKVIEVLAVPDYKKYIAKDLNEEGILVHVEHAFKEQWTQLQWRFTKTSDPAFPTGVKVQYKTYAQDSRYVELRPVEAIQWKPGCQPDRFTGLQPVEVLPVLYPTNGMHVLSRLPPMGIYLEVAPFNNKAPQVMMDSSKFMKSYFKKQPTVLKEWDKFFENYFPDGSEHEHAYEEVTGRRLHVPFACRLFGIPSFPPLDKTVQCTAVAHYECAFEAVTTGAWKGDFDPGEPLLATCKESVEWGSYKNPNNYDRVHLDPDPRIISDRLLDSRKTLDTERKLAVNDRVKAPWWEPPTTGSEWKFMGYFNATVRTFTRSIRHKLSREWLTLEYDDGDFVACIHESMVTRIRGKAAAIQPKNPCGREPVDLYSFPAHLVKEPPPAEPDASSENETERSDSNDTQPAKRQRPSGARKNTKEASKKASSKAAEELDARSETETEQSNSDDAYPPKRRQLPGARKNANKANKNATKRLSATGGRPPSRTKPASKKAFKAGQRSIAKKKY